ncbi:MAG: MoaD/ThiS family protein [Actinomycetes bacterium]
MATVLVKLSAALVYPSGQTDLECHGSTVGEVIEDCCAARPALAGRVLGDDGRQLVGVFLNGRSIRQLDGLQTAVADGDELRMTPPIAGG